MMQVLVTGAGGYIGAVLVPMLLARGYAVRAVDRFFFGRDRLPDHPRLQAIVEDTRKLDSEHFHDVDAVMDLAAISNDPSGERFQEATWGINRDARIRTARIARRSGVKRYILPSSCSVYGFQEAGVTASEASPINPLTTYAKANADAEAGILPLASDGFCVVALRQATVYGLSPRMRFDLAINGMTYGAWKTGRLPLMRDGSQWRPMVHVTDTAQALMMMLEADADLINGRIFNVGSTENTYQIGALGHLVAEAVPGEVEIEWYGDPDTRSYRVAFDRIEQLGYRTRRCAADGVAEIITALQGGALDRTQDTITLDWYSALSHWHKIIRATERYGGMLDINA